MSHSRKRTREPASPHTDTTADRRRDTVSTPPYEQLESWGERSASPVSSVSPVSPRGFHSGGGRRDTFVTPPYEQLESPGGRSATPVSPVSPRTTSASDRRRETVATPPYEQLESPAEWTVTPEMRSVSPVPPVSPVSPRMTNAIDRRREAVATPSFEILESLAERSASRSSYYDVNFMVKAAQELRATEDDLLEARTFASQYTLAEVKLLMQQVHKVHKHDPNFPYSALQRIEEFLDEAVHAPDKNQALVQEMKLEAALITNNSPYAEVRAVVENYDVDEPCSTIRSWAIGILFAIPMALANQLFSISYPHHLILSNVVQLLAWPVGKAWEITLPDVGVTLFGVHHSINPGRFSRKEHMLITIMANSAYNPPYTSHTMWVQYLPQYFNLPHAASFTYQILLALSTNLFGYGIAGLCRRFVVHPSYCIWPTALVTVALNSALHKQQKNPEVRGPGGTLWRASRRFFFYGCFAAMKVWYWLPSFLWTSTSNFSWMSWIAPAHRELSVVTGFNNGLGVNPWPTFNWKVLLWDGVDPLVMPLFATISKFVGALGSMAVVLGLWYSNSYNTGYLPINSDRVYNNRATNYSAPSVLGKNGMLDEESYESYSPPFISAGNIVGFMFFFAVYTAILTYAALYHGGEIARGAKSLFNNIVRRKADTGSVLVVDIHNRLMRRYAEVPEWWHLIVLLAATASGLAGIISFQTLTSPGVVFYGFSLSLLFAVPVGIVKAITGIEVHLKVLSEFLGGAFVQGNALSMNHFKTFGYATTARTVLFSENLKLGHYVKVPPRQNFVAQVAAAVVSAVVCTGALSFQMNRVEGACTSDVELTRSCRDINSLFTSTVFWGAIGPKRIWGSGGLYTETLVGFPLGVVVVLGCYFLGRVASARRWARGVHPVAMVYGGILWAPYNMSYMWPAVPVAWFSWVYLRGRYLGLWSKYNYALSAAFSCGIAITGIIVYFSLQWRGVELTWWGNSVNSQGCEASPCVLKRLGDLEYFGPRLAAPKVSELGRSV